jgi:tRNA (cmo5U34)-methyltransferase
MITVRRELMPNLTKEVFDATASTYDRDRARLIPGCDAFYRWAVDLIPAGAKTIVDLGAGSGLLTQLVRQRFPNARIHLIDFSAAMLDLARKRLGDDPNLTFTESDYSSEPIPSDVCSIVSSLSIHHLDDAAKQRVFRKAYEALKPRGVFINAEQVAGPTPELDDRYRALWLQQVRALGASDQQIADSLYRQQQDHCVDVGRQLAWIREAGFADADCWYKEARFAVLAGTRH